HPSLRNEGSAQSVGQGFHYSSYRAHLALGFPQSILGFYFFFCHKVLSHLASMILLTPVLQPSSKQTAHCPVT
ncbi:hypothetical protein ANANG_G00282010, partial [Anguilla anguilla]